MRHHEGTDSGNNYRIIEFFNSTYMELSMPNRQANILIVNRSTSSPSYQSSITSNFQFIGIVSVPSAKKALPLISKQHFSLLILDLDLSEIKVFSSAALTLKIDALRKLPILIISDTSHESIPPELASNLGTFDVINKPINIPILINKIKLFLELDAQRAIADNLERLNNKLTRDYAHLLNSADEGIIGLDMQGKVTFANPKAITILQSNEKDITSSHISNYFSEAPETVNKEPTNELNWRNSEIFMALENSSSCQTEDEVWESQLHNLFNVGYHCTPVFDQKNRCTGGILMFQDITVRKNTENNLEVLVNYDPLTNLVNRHFFHEALLQAIKRAENNHRQFAILYVDVDHFKNVNETYGHLMGDKLLLEISEWIKSCIHSGDLISRLSGDEFAILMYDIESTENVNLIADSIVKKLAQGHKIDNEMLYATVSIGIAIYPDAGTSSEGILKAADAAMYRVKKSGRNHVQLFSKDLKIEIASRERIIRFLNKSDFQKEFSLVYQPKFSLVSNTMVGAEALLRWNCEGQHIPPDKFIPIAEESGKICSLGSWVLFHVCHEFNQWRHTYKHFKDLSVSVNVSPCQLRAGNFDITVIAALQASGLDPAHLEIEITETAIMDNPKLVIDELKRIQNLGVKISIDDFGTGYSSLNYLKRLPIYALKIDKSFTMDIDHEENDEAIVRAVIAIAHSLDITVIAEGVETFSQLMFLDANCCDQVQGYYFSKPLTATAFTQLFTDEGWKYTNIFPKLTQARNDFEVLENNLVLLGMSQKD